MKKIINEQSLFNIGNAVRAKSGNISLRTLQQLETDILSLKSVPNENIPDYIYTESKRLAEVVKSHQSPNSVSFICCSDLHEDGTKTISKHNAMAAYLVKKYAQIDFGVFLGDHIRGGSSDTETTSLTQYKSLLPQLAWWCDASVNGNHDNGMGWWDGFLTAESLYQLIGRNAVNVVKPETETDRGYYYFDVPQKNFRVIMLNTNDLKGIEVKDHSVSDSYCDGHRVSVPQLQWFAQTLAAIPEGYRFIVCSHEPIHWFDYTYTDANGTTWDMAQKWRIILDAYAGGTSFSITQDGQTVSGDFSNSNKGVLIGTFHGHTHNFIDGKYGDNSIIRVSTPNACNGRTNEYGYLPANPTQEQLEFAEKYGELDENGNRVTEYFKTAVGTAKETAFVVNTIDFDNQVIYSDYYGAGHSRVIAYGTVTSFTVTNNIGAHCSSDNSAVTVEQGSTYTATITADTDYMASVTVTMGGVDITSAAYSNGVITISNVTGNIVITATARFTGNYVPVVGYTDDIRWSAGDGTQRTASGYTGVNEIAIDRSSLPVSYTLSGINWNNDSNCVIVGYENGTMRYANYMNSSATDNNSGVTITPSGNGEVTVTFFQGNKYNLSTFKVSGFGSGANAVINCTGNSSIG